MGWAGDRFQSTHPCGVRPHAGPGCRLGLPVSIHAPLRGATTVSASGTSSTVGFNPRTPAGCDSRLFQLKVQDWRFQSTHPCGVRRSNWSTSSRPTRFQSTHPCGVRRAGQAGYCADVSVSIHAPLRGATGTPGRTLTPIVRVSIHAPLRGATIMSASGLMQNVRFQSTHPCGVRPRV